MKLLPENSLISCKRLKTSGRGLMIAQIKQNPKASIFRDNNIEIQAKYVDRNGFAVVTVSIYPNEY